MNFKELVQKRYSVRSYASQRIEPEKVAYIIECARQAPSAVNYQPWKFFIVRSEEGRQKLGKCYQREWFHKAPLYIICCADHQLSWKRKEDAKDYADIDIAIAAEHICLAATEQGLGTCWVCNFDVLLCRRLFNIPANIEPIVIIPIGYPSQNAVRPERKRRTYEDLVEEL